MDLFNGLGLSGLALLSTAETRSISAENPTGERGGGGRAEPTDPNSPSRNLGRGWKVRPCIELPANSTTTLADVDGPGVIQHIWITTMQDAYTDAVLRFYWDDEETPSVEVPLGDFFCNSFNLRYNINSVPISVNPVGGFNSYWPMPFRKHAKITIENQQPKPVKLFFYQITYSLTEVPDNAAYFHAQYRLTTTLREHPEHTILADVRGQGHYVGTFLAWRQHSNGWWGEGEIKFFFDGDTEYPTICGTGTEDYVGGAWCFNDEIYSTPFLGYPLCRKEAGEVPRHAMYRWHIPDPIRFREELRVTIQALGWWPNWTFQPLADTIGSVAYWYQSEPHGPFPELPSLEARWTNPPVVPPGFLT
jgi:hypothetical protein